MVRLFIDALTKGGPSGVPKPIETYAQDKKRYVGDMLAWLRQCVPSEKENLLLFLKECNTTKEGKIDIYFVLSNFCAIFLYALLSVAGFCQSRSKIFKFVS